ncbi:MAG: GTP 3',8-cyclase MoaA [Candidatus Krumholzibacteria bacterium]
MSALIDSFGRRVTTLRISLTDRCNFRCVYCMPPEGLSVMPTAHYLTVEQIARFARVIGALGVSRFRLTGGEPLLRKEVIAIVAALKRITFVRELSVTTNGSNLAKLAGPLRRAGLDRVNVSLDSLDPDRFARVTRYAHYQRVRDGIDAAVHHGFPVKLNVVVMRGITDDEILAFVRLAVDHELEVRFLEFMPLCGSGWRPDLVYPIGRVRELIAQRFEMTERPRGDRPAQTFSLSGGRGRVGFIAPLSEPFCENCSRIRVSADGNIRPCLFSDFEVAVGGLLRENATDERVADVIRYAVAGKPAGSQFADEPFDGPSSAKSYATSGPLIRSIGG